MKINKASKILALVVALVVAIIPAAMVSATVSYDTTAGAIGTIDCTAGTSDLSFSVPYTVSSTDSSDQITILVTSGSTLENCGTITYSTTDVTQPTNIVYIDQVTYTAPSSGTTSNFTFTATKPSATTYYSVKIGGSGLTSPDTETATYTYTAPDAPTISVASTETIAGSDITFNCTSSTLSAAEIDTYLGAITDVKAGATSVSFTPIVSNNLKTGFTVPATFTNVLKDASLNDVTDNTFDFIITATGYSPVTVSSVKIIAPTYAILKQKFDSQGRTSISTTSDVTGVFTITKAEDTTPKTWTINLDTNLGYTPTSNQTITNNSIVVQRGDTATDVTLSYLIEQAGYKSITVTYTIAVPSASGFTVSGYTVAGATVAIGSNSTTAGSDGSFSLTGISAGACNLAISIKGAVTRTISIAIDADYVVSLSTKPITLIIGDATADGLVDNDDLGGVKSVFGKISTDTGFDSKYDLTNDNIIDNDDLGAVKSTFGSSTSSYQTWTKN